MTTTNADRHAHRPDSPERRGQPRRRTLLLGRSAAGGPEADRLRHLAAPRKRGRTSRFPARQSSVKGERRSFGLLRHIENKAAQQAVRDPNPASVRRRCAGVVIAWAVARYHRPFLAPVSRSTVKAPPLVDRCTSRAGTSDNSRLRPWEPPSRNERVRAHLSSHLLEPQKLNST